jgi:antitoxin VapB
MKIEAIEIQNSPSGQAIQLPEEFRIDDDKVYLKKNGNVIHIIPYHSPWQSIFESLDQFTGDYMNQRDQPLQQNRESFD